MREQGAEAHAAQSSGKTSLMAGSIQEIPLPDLLQLFHTAKKTGVLIVKHSQEGKIYLRQGRGFYPGIHDNHSLRPGKRFHRALTLEVGGVPLRAAAPPALPGRS